jgi:Short C-terminal domain
MTGYLQITSPGFQGNIPGSYWSNDKKHDPWKLPNCIPVGRGAAAKMQASLGLVRDRIASGTWADDIGRPPSEASPDDQGQGGGRLAQQLKELAALHQAGALSDEEFAQAKRKLLG